MDWTLIVLVLILIALWAIKSSLDNITNVIANKPNPTPPQPPDFSGVEEQLENIFKILGGEVKIKDARTKKRKDLYTRYIKALMAMGQTAKQAETEANNKFEEKEFSEAHDTNKIDYSSPFYEIENWVLRVEIEERNKKKYGDLLPKAREFIKGKTIIQPNEMNLTNALKTDYEGGKWLIEKLKQEKRLKEVTEYVPAHEDYSEYGSYTVEGTSKLKHYEVLEAEK